MKVSKTFSIIIPVYNGQDIVGRALDSIYSQGLAEESFQVICVDDSSPTMETFDVLNNYKYNGTHPSNLLVLRHELNRRQGGARNTALLHAEGEWILYLDQDDLFVGGNLRNLLGQLNDYAYCDIVMFDYEWRTFSSVGQNVVCNVYVNRGLMSDVITGGEFIRKYPMPWTPWCYAYKRTFLFEHGIAFAENVRFEDIDYVMKCTLFARKMVFLPICIYCHIEHGENTSFIGNDRNKLEDMFRISIRMRDVAENFMQVDYSAGMAAMRHHIYHYHDLLVRYLWRQSYSHIIGLLKTYPPYEQSDNWLINNTSRNPHVYALLALLLKPILLGVLQIKKMINE